MASVTRDQLKAAIEAGIVACPELLPPEREKLRAFGATAKRVLTGEGEFRGVKCPLAACGLYEFCFIEFALAFDTNLYRSIGWGVIFEVVN